MKAFKSIAKSFRGPTTGSEIDEASTEWKIKSGRDDGPDTCKYFLLYIKQVLNDSRLRIRIPSNIFSYLIYNRMYL